MTPVFAAQSPLPAFVGEAEDPPDDLAEPPECGYSPEMESELDPTEETLLPGELDTVGLMGWLPRSLRPSRNRE